VPDAERSVIISREMHRLAGRRSTTSAPPDRRPAPRRIKRVLICFRSQVRRCRPFAGGRCGDSRQAADRKRRAGGAKTCRRFVTVTLLPCATARCGIRGASSVRYFLLRNKLPHSVFRTFEPTPISCDGGTVDLFGCRPFGMVNQASGSVVSQVEHVSITVV